MGKKAKISLLTALPHSLADVEASASDPQNDYVVNQLLKYYSPKDVWRLVGPHLGGAAEALFEWCGKNCITVVRKATLNNVRTAAAASDVVIVLAHWKGAAVRWTDLTAPVNQLGQSIQLCQSIGILGLKAAPLVAEASEDDSRAKLANCLTMAIRRWPKWLDLGLQPAQTAMISNFFAQSMARERIDEIFGGGILPGARLELNDGLWRPADIANCFPLGWSGICDFACCTSSYLSDVVKSHHGNAIFRADSRILRPETVIRATRSILEKVRSGTRDYVSAAYEANEEYGDL
ncbi:hypothetical protein ABIC09_000862 [Bradyrhizobium sp. S3.12.5]|uniref:hypothetical protein n=1 Tax=Bradyrhizobium sp. S3.12.5 TaxID=3156386 RepID=UPI0033931AB1